jgi:hypothetical protein
MLVHREGAKLVGVKSAYHTHIGVLPDLDMFCAWGPFFVRWASLFQGSA